MKKSVWVMSGIFLLSMNVHASDNPETALMQASQPRAFTEKDGEDSGDEQPDNVDLRGRANRFEKRSKRLKELIRQRDCCMCCLTAPVAACCYACKPVALVCNFAAGMIDWATCGCCCSSVPAQHTERHDRSSEE